MLDSLRAPRLVRVREPDRLGAERMDEPLTVGSGYPPLVPRRRRSQSLKEASVEEIFPITAGLVCGLLLGPLTAKRRLVVGLTVSIIVGFLATVVSGEWRVSWAFLLIDIPLVAVSATAGFLLSRTVVLRGSTERSP